MDEKKYAIYNISAKWTHDFVLPEFSKNGDGTSFNIMLKEDPGISGANQKAMNWWEKRIKEPHRNYPKNEVFPTMEEANVQLLELRAKFVRKETWCGTWFSHYTFNIHLSDDELLVSFASFIDRMMPFEKNLEQWHSPNLDKETKAKLETYCLMGAQDNWRWKGPCRCKDCIAQGVVRIDH